MASANLVDETLELNYNVSFFIETACINNRPSIVDWLLDQNYPILLDKVLHHACLFGRIEIVNIILNKVPHNDTYDDLYWQSAYLHGCDGACLAGNLDIFMMVNKDTFRNLTLLDVDSKYYDLFFVAGCGGNIDLVFYILGLIQGYHIENGIVTFDSVDGDVVNGDDNDAREETIKQIFNCCLVGGCKGGNHHIIKFAVDNGANDWNEGMLYACENNHIKTVKLMAKYGANDWNNGLIRACECEGSTTESALYMIECGANAWNDGLSAASTKENNMEFVKLMIEHGANNWNEGLVNACGTCNMDVVNLMIAKGADNWNEALANTFWQNIDLKNLLVRKGATNLNELYDDDEFKLACCHTRHKGEDPSNDVRCTNLLKTYPVYVLLCSKCEGTSTFIRKLPHELFRLLHLYF